MTRIPGSTPRGLSPAHPPARRSGRGWLARVAVAGVGVLCAACAGADSSEIPSSPSTGTADERYSVSFQAGQTDPKGNFLGGTELMNLVAFQGKLYAGVGYWEDDPQLFPAHVDPRSGPQILVLDSRESQWRQEASFSQKDVNGRFKYGRISSMGKVTFHYDYNGTRLSNPVDILLVGLDVRNGAVFTQRSPGNWEDTLLPTGIQVRSFAVHYDAIARTEKLYVAAGNGETGRQNGAIYSGTFDPSSRGQIRWSSTPEFTDFKNRAMSVVDCDGHLFFAAKPSIYERNDRDGTWSTVYSYPLTPYNASKYVSGFRGLTCESNPTDSTKVVLLTAFEGMPGDVMMIDPETKREVLPSFHTARFLRSTWGDPPAAGNRHTIVGYNDIPLVHTKDGDYRLFGLLAQTSKADLINSAWILSRKEGVIGPDAFTLHQVTPLPWQYHRSDNKLWSVRTIIVSPFAKDKGQVLYLGGYDGHFAPDHNTAWLYRVGVNTALQPFH